LITSDFGFKVTFGNENNTLFLRQALQVLIGSLIPIIEVTFDKTTFDGASRDSRSGIFDLAYIDEAGNHFLIEMQVSTLMEMMQRMKLHALQKFNTLIFKGDYQYKDLPKIYSIAILKEKLSDDHKDYHEIGCIRSEKGRVMDQQMKFVLVELGKFTKTAEDRHTDLDKLLFTMKALVQNNLQCPNFQNFGMKNG